MPILFMALFLLAGLAQFVLGFMGLEYLFGVWVAVLGIGFAMTLRFVLPLGIGSWFGAIHVLGLPWWLGILAVAPGIIFVVPALFWEFAGDRVFGNRSEHFWIRRGINKLTGRSHWVEREDDDDADFYDSS